VCKDFDFCQNCENQVEHEHPFIKIKIPLQNKCPYFEGVNVNKGDHFTIDHLIERFSKKLNNLSNDERSKIQVCIQPLIGNLQNLINPGPSSVKPEQQIVLAEEKIEEPKKVEALFDVQLTKEVSLSPEVISEKDLVLYRTIELKNTGTKDWPKNVYVKSNGDIKSENAILNSLPSGKSQTAILIIKSPCKAGKYVMPWRVYYNDEKANSIPIGEPFNITFEIQASQIKPSMPQMEEIKVNKEEKPVQKPIEKPVEKPIEPKPLVTKIYSPDVTNKARTLKEFFPEQPIEFYLEYVNGAKDKSIDELINDYLTLSEKK